jgi:tellurite resistance protein
MILFAWFVVSRWMSDRQQVAHATPAWIIPVVGLLDVPLALPSLGLPPMHGLMVFALAGGLFFAVPLFTLVFSRLVFEPPLPVALKPSLLILVAPFAVGYSCRAAWATPELGSLLPLSGVLVGSQLPLAAASIAALRFAVAQPGLVTDVIAIGLLTLATLVIAALLGQTVVGLFKGELRSLSA